MVTNMVTKQKALPSEISAAEFKAKCLELMDEVARTGKSVIVTKRGRPVAQLSPVRRKVRSARGILKGRIKILGDIISPIDVEWNANK
jgi:prevent-host-death family protein